MANTVKLKRSAVSGKVPTTGDLELGELALNTNDGVLFFKRDVSGSESVVKVATNTNLLSYTRVTSNTTAVSRQSYIADTSGGTFTITLPASPATGDFVTIVDGASFLTNALTVGRNSSTIVDTAENLSLNIEGVSVTLVYDGSTWEVYTQVGAQGGDAGSSEVTGSSTTTFTNKTISGASNTLSNIGNSSLTNSSISINGSAISLGGSVSSLVTLTGTETLTNKTLISPTINAGALSGTFSGDTTLSGNINITGALTLPNRPAFRVVGNGGAITATTTVTSSHWTLDYQQGSALNTTTGIFTAPIAGLYQVNLVIRTNTNSSGNITQAIVRKTAVSSGAVTAQIMVEFAANTSMNHAGGSTIVKMEVGDTLKLDVTVGTISFDGNDNWSVAYIG